MGMIGRTYSFAKWCHFYSRLFSLVTATGRVHGYSIGAFIYAPGLPVQRDWQLHDERGLLCLLRELAADGIGCPYNMD
ncbi:hypothetical protein M432DRAFT_605214 [Thermoascus aurantiacus ATCC 26904]